MISNKVGLQVEFSDGGLSINTNALTPRAIFMKLNN